MQWGTGPARIPNVVYGAKNQKFGAAGELGNDILTDERLNHRVDVDRHLESECRDMQRLFPKST